MHWVEVQESAKGLTLMLVARASMGEADTALEKRAAAPATMVESCMLMDSVAAVKRIESRKKS